MADKTQLEQMLEHLVNDEQAKAEELFHEYVVAKSREIYENLIQEEMDEEEVDEASEKDEDESVDEASKDDDAEEDKVDESSDEEVDESSDDEEVDEEFEEVAVEGDDEEGEMDAMGGDATDDLEADIEDGEEGEKEPEELFTDLESIVDELQAKFDEIKGGDDSEGKEGPEEAPEEEAIVVADEQPDELATFREYVEKVAGGHGAEKKGAADTADNKKSVVDNMKNDMGGTSANIAKGGEASEKNDGGLADINPKDIDSGNVNVPGAKKAADLSAVKGGHGAEKAGAKEQADNKASIFRGRR